MTMTMGFPKIFYTLLTISLLLGSFGPREVDGGIFTSISRTVTRFLEYIFRYFYRTPPAQAKMSTPQMIEYNGYPVEEHQVETKDGYILTVFRIPRGRRGAPPPAAAAATGGEAAAVDNRNLSDKNRASGRARPVVLMHGDASSSNDWLLQPSDVAFPYMLADREHDVWLPNARGNNYSMAHKSLTAEDKQFWDFSWDEVAKYDVPAVINYVLKATKSSQLHFVGHSSGTTVFFGAVDSNNGLNKKVRKMVAFAPPYILETLRTRLFSFIPKQAFENFMTRLIPPGRMIPAMLNSMLKKQAPYICYGDIPREFCNNIIYTLGGYNPQQMTPETASLISGHTPSDTSIRLMLHVGQAISVGRVRYYDYGANVNQEKYGAPEPPEYDLSKVTVPIQAWYGLNDAHVHPTDAKKTVGLLGNVREFLEVGHPQWTHLDFIYGKDARFYVFDKAAKYLEDD